jgi:quinol monooxygenase YgiN
MIVVNVKLETNPGAVEALKEAIATVEKLSRAEPGCVDYVFATEINDPTRVRIVEHWVSLDALKFHMAQPHMAAFREALAKNATNVVLKLFDGKELPYPPK